MHLRVQAKVCYLVPHCTVLYCTALHGTVPRFIVLYRAVLRRDNPVHRYGVGLLTFDVLMDVQTHAHI